MRDFFVFYTRLGVGVGEDGSSPTRGITRPLKRAPAILYETNNNKRVGVTPGGVRRGKRGLKGIVIRINDSEDYRFDRVLEAEQCLYVPGRISIEMDLKLDPTLGGTWNMVRRVRQIRLARVKNDAFSGCERYGREKGPTRTSGERVSCLLRM